VPPCESSRWSAVAFFRPTLGSFRVVDRFTKNPDEITELLRRETFELRDFLPLRL
jgi:hypothetical protein